MAVQRRPVPTEMSQDDLFAGSMLFQAIDDAGCQELKAMAEVVTAEAGDVVIEEGEADEAIYLVREGHLVASSHRSGEEVELGKLEPGAIFGEVAELGQTKRTASVKAGSDCALTRFPGPAFMAVLGRFPNAMQTLTSIMLQRASANIEKTLS